MSGRFEFAPAPVRRGHGPAWGLRPRQVLTECPRSGLTQPTHARLTVRQFAALSGPLLYWCSRCRAPHEARRDALWLDVDPRSGVAAAPALRLAAVTPVEVPQSSPANEARTTAAAAPNEPVDDIAFAPMRARR